MKLLSPVLAFFVLVLGFFLSAHAPMDSLSISCGTLTDTHQTAPTAGDPYTAQIVASGGSPAYQFQAGGLPSGLQFDPTTGIVNGAVLQNGTFAIGIGVTDSVGSQAFTTCSLFVKPNPGAHRKK